MQNIKRFMIYVGLIKILYIESHLSSMCLIFLFLHELSNYNRQEIMLLLVKANATDRDVPRLKIVPQKKLDHIPSLNLM